MVLQPIRRAAMKQLISIRCRSMQYLVIAKDYPNGLKQRLLHRQDHLDQAQKAKDSGLILLGGATMTAENEMNRSMILFEAPSISVVEEYLKTDPYVKGRVWESWTITPFRCAAVSKKLIEQ